MRGGWADLIDLWYENGPLVERGLGAEGLADHIDRYLSSSPLHLFNNAPDGPSGPPVVAKVSTNTSTLGLSPDVATLTDVVKALLLKNPTPPPASVKAVEESCVTCGGPHPYYQCLAIDGNASGYQDNIQAYVSAAAVNYNQGNAGHRPPSVAISSIHPVFHQFKTIKTGEIIITQEIQLTKL
ncbi:hypothetical protein Tco_0396299 [Tanacetum coccineum]